MSQSKPGLAILGCGHLCTAILYGLLKSPKAHDFDAILPTTRSWTSISKLKDAVHQMKDVPDITLCDSGPDASQYAANRAQIVILGCKPKQLRGLLQEKSMSAALAGKLIISVVAGVNEEQIKNMLATEQHSSDEFRVACAIPNVAASVGSSTTILQMPSKSKDTDERWIKTIFEAIGQIVVVDEQDMALFAVVCGSGPAFVASIMQNMADAALDMWQKTAASNRVSDPEERDKVQQLLLGGVANTMRGTSELFLHDRETGKSQEAGDICRAVATPGGSTAAGQAVLDRSYLKDVMGQVFLASWERLIQMREESKSKD